MLLGNLGARFSGNMLAGKGINRKGYGYKDIQYNKVKIIIREGYGTKMNF